MPRSLSTKTKLSPISLQRSQLHNTRSRTGLPDFQMMKKTIEEFGRSTSLNTSHLARLQKIRTSYLLAKKDKERAALVIPKRNTFSLKKKIELVPSEVSQEENTYRAEEMVSPAISVDPEEISIPRESEDLEKNRKVPLRFLSIEQVEQRLLGDRNKGIKQKLEKKKQTKREGISNITTRAPSLSSQTELPHMETIDSTIHINPPSIRMEHDWMRKIREGKSMSQIERLKEQLHSPQSRNKFQRREKQSIFTSLAPSALDSFKSKRSAQFNLFNFTKSSILKTRYHTQDFFYTEKAKPLSGVLYKSIGFSKLEPDLRENSFPMTDSMVDLNNEKSQRVVQKEHRNINEDKPCRPRFLLTNVDDIRNIIAAEFHQEAPGVNATRKLIASRKFRAVNRSFIAFVRPECFTKQVIREKLWTEEDTN